MIKYSGSILEALARISASPVTSLSRSGWSPELERGPPLSGLEGREHSVSVCWDGVHPSDLLHAFRGRRERRKQEKEKVRKRTVEVTTG